MTDVSKVMVQCLNSAQDFLNGIDEFFLLSSK
jgi:hypothetical protein